MRTISALAPALRLHALSAQLAGIWAVSLTYAYRITLTLVITEREITLLDIGNHDEIPLNCDVRAPWYTLFDS